MGWDRTGYDRIARGAAAPKPPLNRSVRVEINVPPPAPARTEIESRVAWTLFSPLHPRRPPLACLPAIRCGAVVVQIFRRKFSQWARCRKVAPAAPFTPWVRRLQLGFNLFPSESVL